MEKSPIKSGWRGNLNGYVEKTDSHIAVSEVTIKLDAKTAYALANILGDRYINEHPNLESDQKPGLINLGAALGRLIDNPSANNGREYEDRILK
jgi:hypothetical protein